MDFIIGHSYFLLFFALAWLSDRLDKKGVFKKICTRKVKDGVYITYTKLSYVLFLLFLFVPPFLVSLLPRTVSAVISIGVSAFVFGYAIASKKGDKQ